MSSLALDRGKKSTICSIDTIANRLANRPESTDWIRSHDLVLIDECHDVTSESYKRFFWWMEGFKNHEFTEAAFEEKKERFKKFYLGFTATPFRVGKRTHTFFQKVIAPVTARELRDQGHLVPVRFFRPKDKLDLSDVKIDSKTGDYQKTDLMRAINNKKIIGDVVDLYSRRGNMGRAICFAVDLDHSRAIAAAFKERGIPAIHCDANHTKDERDEAIRSLKSKYYRVLTNVNIFSTGLDCPWLEVEICARPSLSENLVVQQWGRVLRPAPWKRRAIILDHANNSSRFGLPYDDRFPELDDLDKENKKDRVRPGVKDCPRCHMTIVRAAAFCPECKYCFVAKTADGKTDIDYNTTFEKGDLVEVRDSKLSPLEKLLKSYNLLKVVEMRQGLSPNWKYHKLFEKHGETMLRFHDRIGMPDWMWRNFKLKIQQKKEKEKQREKRIIK